MQIIVLPPDDPKYKENENKWMEYKKWYIEAHPLELKEVTKKNFSELKNYKLIAVYNPCHSPRRTQSPDFKFALLQDDWIHFYSIDGYSHERWTVRKVFPEFERERVYFDFIYMWFWGCLYISKDIYEDYSEFVDSKYKQFNLLTPRDMWHNREPVMKMYFDNLENKKIKDKENIN